MLVHAAFENVYLIIISELRIHAVPVFMVENLAKTVCKVHVWDENTEWRPRCQQDTSEGASNLICPWALGKQIQLYIILRFEKTLAMQLSKSVPLIFYLNWCALYICVLFCLNILSVNSRNVFCKSYKAIYNLFDISFAFFMDTFGTPCTCEKNVLF